MKKRNKYPKDISDAVVAAERDGLPILVLSYEISYDPLPKINEQLPKPVKRQVDSLFHLLESDPGQAIEKLIKLKQAYPKTPILYNYLSSAYSRINDRQAAQALTLENYQENPDYLFAKINYAQLCLYEGDPSKIPEIFDNKFDLKLLYPHRNRFHVSEFAGFTGVMCAYYCLTDNRKTAELLYKSLVEVVPDSPMIAFARHFLHPSLFAKFRFWLHGKFQKKLQSVDQELARLEEPSSTQKDDASFEA